MPDWNSSAPGFVGDDNLYGIGIRVGYYTQAISIWVANYYAKQEAPYLHTLTILFLVAMFVGLCQLCSNPKQTYAVEPYLMISVAYYTLYTGLWDPWAPYLLQWEVEFAKQLAVELIWLAFQGLETWYWWVGVWLMKPSNGGWGTTIFYPYVGNATLLGPGEWISIAARVVNILVSIAILTSTIRLCCYTIQQRRVDHLISPERLKTLTTRWLQVKNTSFGSVSHGIVNDDGETVAGPSKVTDEKSADSIMTKENERDTPPSSKNERTADRRQASFKASKEQDFPPPYRRPTRTGTGLLKRALWRRPSSQDVDLSLPPPDYTLYEPSFEDIDSAYNFLKATTECPKKDVRFRGINLLKVWLVIPICIYEIIQYLYLQAIHPWRPAVLLAVVSHAYNLRYGRKMTYAKILSRTLQQPSYRSVNSHDIVIASRIILSSEKPVKPSRMWYFGIGWGTLGVCSILVIGTELTIQWNGIKGVQDLSSVGQLIPFTLGVGGLLKVIYSAVVDRDVKTFCYFENCSNLGKRERWEEIGEQFLQCRRSE